MQNRIINCIIPAKNYKMYDYELELSVEGIGVRLEYKAASCQQSTILKKFKLSFVIHD